MTNPSDYVKIRETSYWRWWTTQDFWNQHQNDISRFFDYPGSCLSRLREDFGYNVPKILDFVDPDSHGELQEHPSDLMVSQLLLIAFTMRLGVLGGSGSTY
jgi:hypothetical protein